MCSASRCVLPANILHSHGLYLDSLCTYTGDHGMYSSCTGIKPGNYKTLYILLKFKDFLEVFNVHI